MTGRLIPNIYCYYEGIRTAPGHRLFAVRQHGVQQQAQQVRVIMRGIIPMGRVGVKYALFSGRHVAVVPVALQHSERRYEKDAGKNVSLDVFYNFFRLLRQVVHLDERSRGLFHGRVAT